MLIPPGTILLLSAMASQFTPPTRAQQLAAIGPTMGLPQPLQRALEPCHLKHELAGFKA